MRHSFWHSCALGLLVGLSTSACVPKDMGERMDRDIKALQGDMQRAQKGLDEQRAGLEEQIATADAQSKKLAKMIEGLQRSSGQTVAGLDVKMEEIKGRIQGLIGDIEMVNHKLGQMDTQLKDLVKRIEGLEALPQDTSSAPNVDASPSPPPDVPKDKKGMVNHGKSLTKAGKMDEARSVLRDVVRKWPKEAGVTDDAYFYLGETYFKEKNYRSALSEYIKVVEKFGKGRLADDAYYRIGECSLEMGSFDDAKIFFTEIVTNHKKSPLAKSARKRLEELRRKRK